MGFHIHSLQIQIITAELNALHRSTDFLQSQFVFFSSLHLIKYSPCPEIFQIQYLGHSDVCSLSCFSPVSDEPSLENCEVPSGLHVSRGYTGCVLRVWYIYIESIRTKIKFNF
jgi:hypothetical protein